MSQEEKRTLIARGWKVSLKWSKDGCHNSVTTTRTMPASDDIADVLRAVAQSFGVDLADCDDAEATTTGFATYRVEPWDVPVGTCSTNGVVTHPSGASPVEAQGPLA